MAALCGNGRLRNDCRQGFPYDDSIPIGLLLIFPLTLHTNRPGYRNIDHRFTVGSHFQDRFCGTTKTHKRRRKNWNKLLGSLSLLIIAAGLNLARDWPKSNGCNLGQTATPYSDWLIACLLVLARFSQFESSNEREQSPATIFWSTLAHIERFRFPLFSNAFNFARFSIRSSDASWAILH